MYNVAEQITSANKASVETLSTIANTAFASAERLAALNLNTARTLLADSVDNTRALFAIKDVQGLLALKTPLTQPDLNKATSYSRRFYDITTQTQEAFARLLKAQVSEMNRNLAAALANAAKSAPVGSDLAVNAMRTALAAANSAYDSFSDAAKQLSTPVDVAEARVVAPAKRSKKAH